jgi:hypothetical protein
MSASNIKAVIAQLEIRDLAAEVCRSLIDIKAFEERTGLCILAWSDGREIIDLSSVDAQKALTNAQFVRDVMAEYGAATPAKLMAMLDVESRRAG